MNIKENNFFICPSCGFKGLDTRPYADMPDSVERDHYLPPYKQHWGQPSYDICSCCGYEFGLSDDPIFPNPGESFATALVTWFQDGSHWFEPRLRPENWDLVRQLELAGIPVPKEIKIARQLPASKNKR